MWIDHALRDIRYAVRVLRTRSACWREARWSRACYLRSARRASTRRRRCGAS